EVTGIGDRAALAAAFGDAGAGGVRPLVGIPVVAVGGQVAVALVGERQQLQLVVVVDAPVHLGAPETVVGPALIPGRTGVAGVLGIAVALLVHGEQEQAVADERTGRPHVGLGEAAAITAAAVDRGGSGAVGVLAGDDAIPAGGLPRFRLERQLHAAFELVAARARDRVDHAAGGTAELDRVAAGLDLVLLEERERRGGIALAAVEVGDVEAVDEDGVLGHRGAAERNAAERRVAGDHARGQQRHRAQALLHRKARPLLAGDVGRRLGGVHVDAVDH